MTLSYASPSVMPPTLDLLDRPAPTAPTTFVGDDRRVVALRERAVVAPGSLLDHRPLEGSALVSARDLADRQWWIPARAVWPDVDSDGRHERPWPVGLANRGSRHVAILTGLSDRLGWEAEVARRNGVQLPVVEGLGAGRKDGTVILDGRLAHDVPTVVVVSDHAVLWGAGSTMAAAYHRALYGDRGELGGRRELDQLGRLLADAGLEVVAVDLATAVMSEHGVHRLSVQVMVPSHEPGRPWDADPVN
jgi:hypothetical protein